MAGNANETVKVMGIDIEPNKDAALDIDVLDMMDDIADGKIYKVKKMLSALVGDDTERVLAELKGANGRVSVEDATQFITDYFEAVGLKN